MLMLVKQKIHNRCRGYRDAKDDNQTTAEVANEIKVNVSNLGVYGEVGCRIVI
jgi:hypothetical protein